MSHGIVDATAIGRYSKLWMAERITSIWSSWKAIAAGDWMLLGMGEQWLWQGGHDLLEKIVSDQMSCNEA